MNSEDIVNSEDNARLRRSIDTFVSTVNVLESHLGYSEIRVSSIERLLIQSSKQKQSKAVSNKNPHFSCLSISEPKINEY